MNSNGTHLGTVHTAPVAVAIHKLMPIAVLYFFLNSAGLPTGLFYTTLLSPILLVWLYLEGERWLTVKFLACLSPFIVAHSLNGVDSRFYYARSCVLLWTVFVTTYAFYWALIKCKSLDRLFDQLITLNFWVALSAVVSLYTPLSKYLWNDNLYLTEGGPPVLRLKLLTSEPSVYALLMAPLLIFAVLRLVQRPGKRNGVYVAIIAIPFLLSQSFGGLSICAVAIGVAILVSFRRLIRGRNVLLIVVTAVILVTGLLIVPNPISLRVSQVVAGTDSSARSRTDNGLIVAYAIAGSKSLWWGAGLGQAKLNDVSMLGAGFNVGVIPNSLGSTFAELGIIAVVIKLAFETYLFFRTRVYKNTFRLAIWVFIFLYQFTGSDLTNVQEYLLWSFAFGPFFPAFDLLRSDVSPPE